MLPLGLLGLTLPALLSAWKTIEVDPSPAMIRGGEPVQQDSRYPYMVAVLFGHQAACGGVILTENLVLTAAHCIIPGTKRLPVYVGRLTIDSADLDHRFAIESVAVPPQRPRPTGIDDPVLSDDIGLLKLARSTQVEPVTLSQGTHRRRDCVTLGWGMTGPNSFTMVLNELTGLRIGSDAECTKWYQFFDPYGSLCAFGSRSGTGSCGGDSGGPLLCPAVASGALLLVGITSFGLGDCNYNRTFSPPSFYTRVSRYLDWIERNRNHFNETDYYNEPVLNQNQHHQFQIERWPGVWRLLGLLLGFGAVMAVTVFVLLSVGTETPQISTTVDRQ